MSKSLNRADVIGNLGGKPESRFTPSGRQVTTVSIATTRSWKTPEGETASKTEWHNVEFWGNLAKIVAEHLDKGSRVFVSGRLETDKYQHKTYPDVTMSRAKIVGLELIMLGDAKGGAPVGETIVGDDAAETVGEAAGAEEEFPF